MSDADSLIRDHVALLGTLVKQLDEYMERLEEDLEPVDVDKEEPFTREEELLLMLGQQYRRCDRIRDKLSWGRTKLKFLLRVE